MCGGGQGLLRSYQNSFFAPFGRDMWILRAEEGGALLRGIQGQHRSPMPPYFVYLCTSHLHPPGTHPRPPSPFGLLAITCVPHTIIASPCNAPMLSMEAFTPGGSGSPYGTE